MEAFLRTTRPFAIVLTLALVLTNFIGASPVAAASAAGGTQLQSRSQRFDGETLFRALAFAQGPAASLFPEFAGFKAPSAQQLAVIDRLIARLGQMDPGFFASFASIQNGNRPNIRRQLERAGLKLHEAINAEFGAPTAGGVQPACIDIVVFVALVVVLDIAAVVTVVIDVTAAEVVNLVLTGNVVLNVDLFFAPVAGGGVALSPLAKDQWVDRIAQRLAG
jgi:SdpC family antimicrobial peptide